MLLSLWRITRVAALLVRHTPSLRVLSFRPQWKTLRLQPTKQPLFHGADNINRANAAIDLLAWGIMRPICAQEIPPPPHPKPEANRCMHTHTHTYAQCYMSCLSLETVVSPVHQYLLASHFIFWIRLREYCVPQRWCKAENGIQCVLGKDSGLAYFNKWRCLSSNYLS